VVQSSSRLKEDTARVDRLAQGPREGMMSMERRHTDGSWIRLTEEQEPHKLALVREDTRNMAGLVEQRVVGVTAWF
jgi:hypothetical protein